MPEKFEHLVRRLAAAALLALPLTVCFPNFSAAEDPQPPATHETQQPAEGQPGQLYLCGNRWTNTPCEGGKVMELRGVSRLGASDSKPAAASSPAVAAPAGREMTRLRIQDKPAWNWQYKRTGTAVVLAVTSATVMVKNAGDVRAEDIRVVLTFPKAAPVQLSGPETIERNKTGKYSLVEEVEVPSQAEPKVNVSCSNCRS